MAEVQRYGGELVDAETGEVLPASPWRYTEEGRPVFESRSYDEHEGEWINKQQEGNAILWEMSAISYSLVGLAVREADAQGVVKRFAGVVKTSARRIQQLAETYALRVKLEDEGRNRFRPLIETLDFQHFSVAASQVLNRAETNALEAGEWLEKADDEGWTGAELKRQIVAAKRAALDASMPDGVYRVIYADPPWEYANSGLGGSAESHYPTMSTDDLCGDFADDVKARAADDAVLFMWATNPLLTDAIRVMEAWGFEYKTNLAWVKNQATYGKLGFYVRGKHELLLVGVRGSMIPEEERRPESVVAAPLGKHSKKPHEFYELVESMYPSGPYLELFARNKRSGWSSFGNQLGGAA
ncbi:MAG: hypothetical protein CYG60_12300 [Actinobacteria bacterium]|nr:MAG: hypothetical protein CYG60_12300 [Actinomycetota bacterium]